MHARVPVSFAIQETKSWDIPNGTLPGHVCYGSELWFATLLVSKQFCTISDIVEIRREMCSNSLGNHSGDGS